MQSDSPPDVVPGAIHGSGDEGALLAAIIASSDDAIVSKTLEGVITSWNPAAERMFGYTADEAIGQSIMMVIPADRHDEERMLLERLCCGERIEHYETLRMAKDGHQFPVSLTVSPVRDATGRIIGASKIARDIGERIRAEAALRRSESNLADFFENASMGLHWVGPDGTILRVNRAELEMLGYTAEEYLGRNIVDFYADREVIDDILARLWRGEQIQELAARLRCKDGSIRYVRISSNVLWEDGKFVHTRCFTRDVTGQVRVQELVQQRARELEEFAYITSHDLKEPLRGIHNYASMLLEEKRAQLDAEGQRMLQSMSGLCLRMDALLDSVLDYARVGRGELELQTVDVGAVVREVLELLQPRLEQEPMTVELRPLAPARADRELLAEVFRNLVSNAIKYNDKPRKRLEIGMLGEHVYYVRDNGIGIAEKHHRAVFRMFKRLHDRTAYGGGTGAGLAIVKRIVEQHGGRIRVESTPGEGSTFSFSLSAVD